jgi:hypothetical protein
MLVSGADGFFDGSPAHLFRGSLNIKVRTATGYSCRINGGLRPATVRLFYSDKGSRAFRCFQAPVDWYQY